MRKKTGLIAGGAAVLLGSSLGYAVWSASGTGPARARASTAPSASTIPVTGSVDLSPGVTGGDVYFAMSNPGSVRMTITSMTPGTITSADPLKCPATTVDVASTSGLDLSIAAGSTSPRVVIHNVVSMAPDAPDSCQDVKFTINMTLIGTQSTTASQ